MSLPVLWELVDKTLNIRTVRLKTSPTVYDDSSYMHVNCDELKTRSASTISKVATDWHALMIPQRTMRPSIARIQAYSLQVRQLGSAATVRRSRCKYDYCIMYTGLVTNHD